MSLDPMPSPEQLLRMKAEREARAVVPRPQLFGAPTTPIIPHPGLFVPASEPIVPPAPTIEWPVHLLLPWSLLVSDNDRKEPYTVHTDDGPKARMRLTPRYREAKDKIEQLARRKLGDVNPHVGPLELTALVFVPGGRLDADVVNFAKGVHDALEGVVYRNDRWLHATHWLRASVDVDAPRAEITITPLIP